MSKRSTTSTYEIFTPFPAHETPIAINFRRLLTEEYANAMAIKTDFGEANTGHLGNFMPEAEFLILPGINNAYAIPVSPNEPVLAGDATARANQKLIYEIDVTRCKEYHAIENKIKTRFSKPFLRCTAKTSLGDATVRARDILEHLTKHYGTIHPEDLETILQSFENEMEHG